MTNIYNMEYKEQKKRVTKNDKKNKREVYSAKHVRNMLKQKEASLAKKNDGPIHAPERPLLTNGRIKLHRGAGICVHR
jgi:hypothetical protein